MRGRWPRYRPAPPDSRTRTTGWQAGRRSMRTQGARSYLPPDCSI
jgi:hypothetical protein